MTRAVTSPFYGVTGLNTGCGRSFGSLISGSGSGSYLSPVPILPKGIKYNMVVLACPEADILVCKHQVASIWAKLRIAVAAGTVDRVCFFIEFERIHIEEMEITKTIIAGDPVK